MSTPQPNQVQMFDELRAATPIGVTVAPQQKRTTRPRPSIISEDDAIVLPVDLAKSSVKLTDSIAFARDALQAGDDVAALRHLDNAWFEIGDLLRRLGRARDLGERRSRR